MGQYLIAIYENETSWANAGQEVADRTLEEHNVFGENNAVVLRGGARLHTTDTATSVRKDSSGGFVVTDGPFVETKEALGGYYLAEAADLDEAIAVAKQVSAPFGGVEVRPLRVLG